MNFDLYPTTDVDNALEELYKQFEEMQIIENGEIQHSINLLFMLSEAKHIDKTIDDIYLFFLEYVRKLQKNNKFPPADLLQSMNQFETQHMDMDIGLMTPISITPQS